MLRKIFSKRPKQNSHGQSTDVPLVSLQQVHGGKGPVLAHHVRYLSREITGGCREHLPHIGCPGGSVIPITVDGDKPPLEQVPLKSVLHAKTSLNTPACDIEKRKHPNIPAQSQWCTFKYLKRQNNVVSIVTVKMLFFTK